MSFGEPDPIGEPHPFGEPDPFGEPHSFGEPDPFGEPHQKTLGNTQVQIQTRSDNDRDQILRNLHMQVESVVP
jgi:hypothetical protein